MATRLQNSTRPSVPVAVESKNKKPQQDIVNNESLRRLYAIALKSRIAGNGRQNSTLRTTVQAAATIELTAEDAIALESGELAIAEQGTAATNGDGPKQIPRDAAGASQLSIAAGVALEKKRAGKQAVVVALATAESLSRGASFEALSYASAHKLPLVLVADNMHAAHAAGRPDLMTVAQAHGVPAFLVDSEDAVAVYRVAREAIHRARSGRGPSLIECREFESDEDPLRHLERYLEKHGLWTPQWKRKISAAAV